VQCENGYKQEKFGKRTKFLRELSDPESLDRSHTDSETIKQAIKARETRLTVLGLIRKCGHKPISLDPPGSRTKQDRIILFP
jgi:hypothetical protein